MKAYEVTENRRQEPCNRNLRTELSGKFDCQSVEFSLS